MPYNPPKFDAMESVLPILNLRQRQQEQARQDEQFAFRQRLAMEELQTQASERYLRAVELGMDPEVAAQAERFLSTEHYNLGIEAAKIRKQQEKKAGVEASMPAFSAATAGSLDAGSRFQSPAPEANEAAGQIWLRAMEADPSGMLAQRLNLLATGSQEKTRQEGAALLAQEAKEKRTASHSSGLARRNMDYSAALQERYQIRDEQRKAAGEGAKIQREAVVSVLAGGDPQAKAALADELVTRHGVGGAARILKDARIEAMGKTAERKQGRLTGAGAGIEFKADAMRRWFENPSDIDANIDMVATGQGVLNSYRPPGAPLAIPGDKEMLKGQREAASLVNRMSRMDDLMSQIEKTPDAAAQVRGLAGADLFTRARRAVGRQHPLVAQLAQEVTRATTIAAGVAGVYPISNVDIAMAGELFPLLTEIVGPDGKITPAARARVENMREMAREMQMSVYDESVRQRVQERIEQRISIYTPQQRAALSSLMEAAQGGDAGALRSAAEAVSAAGIGGDEALSRFLSARPQYIRGGTSPQPAGGPGAVVE